MKISYLVILCLMVFLSGAFLYLFPNKAISLNNNKNNSYERIVSLAPSFCETLEALGESQRLVGITIHSNIAEAHNIKKIGSFSNPNLESILALKPDLVLAVPHIMAISTINALEEQNIEVFAHQPDRISDIKYIITILANKLKIPEKGQELNRAITQSLNDAKNLLSEKISYFPDKRAMIAISYAPLVIAGKNSFASEIIEMLGLINASANPDIAWPVWPLEKLLSDPPAFFIVAQGEDDLVNYHELFRKFNLKSLLVVPKKPIFTIPSPTIIKDVKYFSEIILNRYQS